MQAVKSFGLLCLFAISGTVLAQARELPDFTRLVEQ